MTRREFLKGCGAFAVLLAAGWKALPALQKALTPNVGTAVGPLLRDGLAILPDPGGCCVYYQGRAMFKANAAGQRLLQHADGTQTLDEIISETGNTKQASDVAMFFVTLGQAGYLQNVVEVQLFERYV
jgi:hypothetical protein